MATFVVQGTFRQASSGRSSPRKWRLSTQKNAQEKVLSDIGQDRVERRLVKIESVKEA